jgi:hypothetical protein
MTALTGFAPRQASPGCVADVPYFAASQSRRDRSILPLQITNAIVE